MKSVEIFIGGVCKKTPGLGGWCAFIRYKKFEKQISGYCENTTKDRMELLACVEALKVLKEPCKILLTTSSDYIFDGATERLIEWHENNWKDLFGKFIPNSDLWVELDRLTDIHDVEWASIENYQDVSECQVCHLIAMEEIENNAKNYKKYFD